jgi:long-chain acyl-CoA synthetase
LPAALDFVDELPRTSVGKLSRHELRNQQPVQELKQEPLQQQLITGVR